MKKSAKIIAGLTAAFILPCVASAEGISKSYYNNTGDYSQYATINSVDTTSDNYDIQVGWGSLTYDYKKATSDSYQWVPVTGDDNTITVINYSSVPINLGISFTPSISGVQGTFTFSQTVYTTTCNLITSDDAPRGWGEIYVFSDSSCSNRADTSAGLSSYSPNTYYQINVSETSGIRGDALTTINQNIAAATSSAYTRLTATLNLTGGTLSDVQAAFDSDKKIGTVTVSIDDVD